MVVNLFVSVLLAVVHASTCQWIPHMRSPANYTGHKWWEEKMFSYTAVYIWVLKGCCHGDTLLEGQLGGSGIIRCCLVVSTGGASGASSCWREERAHDYFRC